MTKRCSLNDVKDGCKAVVYKLNNEGNIRRRFQDLGLVEGTEVEYIQTSPLGDPVAFCIRGAVIAIRRDDLKKVLVECEV